MNSFKKTTLALFTVCILVAHVASSSAWGDNLNAAKGQPKHRTWVVYEQSNPMENPEVQLLVGDAFRLAIIGEPEARKFTLKPLNKLNKRWGISAANIHLSEPSDDSLCAKFNVTGNEKDFWMHIDTRQVDDLTIALTDEEEGCSHLHEHPGHARAQN